MRHRGGGGDTSSFQKPVSHFFYEKPVSQSPVFCKTSHSPGIKGKIDHNVGGGDRKKIFRHLRFQVVLIFFQIPLGEGGGLGLKTSQRLWEKKTINHSKKPVTHPWGRSVVIKQLNVRDPQQEASVKIGTGAEWPSGVSRVLISRWGEGGLCSILETAIWRARPSFHSNANANEKHN